MDPAELPFARAEFAEWYETYQDGTLRPAAMQIDRTLSEFLSRITETDPRGRVRLGTPRLKSVNRAWLKIQRPQYRSMIAGFDDIPRVIDDLLGIRMVCTNREDVDFLVGRLTEELPEFSLGTSKEIPGYFVAIESESHRNYVREPKSSGYRAFHVNLLTQVGTLREGWSAIRAELQIRTLLQDAWGELTHEDTYKPDAEVSEFVQTLSLRMAEVLAVLDDLAQDLRGELDRTLSESIEAPTGVVAVKSEGDEVASGAGGGEYSPTDTESFDAVAAYVRGRYDALKQPQDLASFAWELQREFGREITTDWLGFGKMVSLLSTILPPEALVTEAPGLLVPSAFEQSELRARPQQAPSRLPQDVQDIALRLRQFDSRFPLLPKDRLQLAYRFLAESHNAQRGQYGIPDSRYVNMVTKLARDLAKTEGDDIGRPDLNYILMALYIKRSLVHNLRAADIATTYSNFVVERCRRLGILSDKESQRTEEMEALHNWLRAGLV